ncbi:MAG TPA: hypothetical protein VK191_03890 [Symbiobacteriaceae bacterium]|nr:hypothetical protein [Symbiobacteriaceae bacterium]
MFQAVTPRETLPAWAEDAIKLLAPTLGVMARPVVTNNIKRTMPTPDRATVAEIELFLTKVERGIVTFSSGAQAHDLVGQLRRLLLRHVYV